MSWDSGTQSSQSLYGDGWVQYTETAINTQDSMVGVGSSTPWVGFPLYTGLAYGIASLIAANQLVVYELGVSKFTGTWVIGDELRVNLTGTTITYLQNGTVIYTSLTAATTPLAAYILLNNGLGAGGTVSSIAAGGPGWFPAIGIPSNPEVMMRMSNDGGKTWGNELWRSAGAIGEYQTRVKWNRCGQARRRVFEVSVTDTAPWRITNAYLTPLQAPQKASQIQKASWGG